VDHKTVDQASFGNTQEDQDVEQSAMFEDMNQTQMTFPPNNLNKADKNQLKIKQLAQG